MPLDERVVSLLQWSENRTQLYSALCKTYFTIFARHDLHPTVITPLQIVFLLHFESLHFYLIQLKI